VISEREQIASLIEKWLSSRLDDAPRTWVRHRQASIGAGDGKGLFLAFGLTPRKVGKADLALTGSELDAASDVRPGWNPRNWSVDQAVRTLFVLSFPAVDPEMYTATLDQLFSAGEVGELVALYQSLPLLPHPEVHILRAAEGIRTNMKAVFCAVAHHNPYPAERFNEDQWNQMVLKCQFMGVPMLPIAGLDHRANARLSAMVVDFIYERRAAKRPIAPELWRCVGPFADARGMADLQEVLTSGSLVEQHAAALALNQNLDPAAKAILESAPVLAGQVAARTITWDTVEQLSTP
jgi:hypothetical protein